MVPFLKELKEKVQRGRREKQLVELGDNTVRGEMVVLSMLGVQEGLVLPSNL